MSLARNYSIGDPIFLGEMEEEYIGISVISSDIFKIAAIKEICEETRVFFKKVC